MEVTNYFRLCLVVICCWLSVSAIPVEPTGQQDSSRILQSRQMYSPYGPSPVVPQQLPPAPGQPFRYAGDSLHAYPTAEDIAKSQKIAQIFRYEVANAEKLRKKSVALKVVSIVAISISGAIVALALMAHFLKKKTIFARAFQEEDVDEVLANVLNLIQKARETYNGA